MQILNKIGHSISYSEPNGLDSEFAYSVTGDQHDASDEIRFDPNLATAEGSMMSFIKVKFHNRCTIIHELLANALEQVLHCCFIMVICEDVHKYFQQAMSKVPLAPKVLTEEHMSDPAITHCLQMYETYFQSILD